MPSLDYLYSGTQPVAAPYTGTTVSNPLALSTNINQTPVTYSGTVTSGQAGTTPTGDLFQYVTGSPTLLSSLKDLGINSTVTAANAPTVYDVTGPIGSSIANPTGTTTTTTSGTGIARLPGTTTTTPTGTTTSPVGTTTGTTPMPTSGATPTVNTPTNLNNIEYQNTLSSQVPTNVLDVRNSLLGTLANYGVQAGQALNAAQGLPITNNLQLKTGFNPNYTYLGNSYNPASLALNQNFQGGQALQDIMRNGPDAIAQSQIAAGIQDINARRDAENQRLINQLGINPGNNDLLSVLQGQNTFQSQLATNPLRAQALQDTLERAQASLGLTNQATEAANAAQQAQTGYNNQTALEKQQTTNQNIMQQNAYNQQNQYLANQLYNQALLQQGGFNQQASLAQLQSLLAGMQPSQNLLEALTNLQGQARGTTSTETNVGARNFT